MFVTDQQGPIFDQLGIQSSNVHVHSYLLHIRMAICMSSNFSYRGAKPTKSPMGTDFLSSQKNIDQLVIVDLENSNCQ